MDGHRTPQLEHGYLRLANDLHEALTRLPLRRVVTRQVIDVVIRESYGRQRKHADLTVPLLCERTGRARQAVHRGIGEAVAGNVLTCSELRPASGCNPATLRLRINKRYWLWVGLPKDWTPSGVKPAPKTDEPDIASQDGATIQIASQDGDTNGQLRHRTVRLASQLCDASVTGLCHNGPSSPHPEPTSGAERKKDKKDRGGVVPSFEGERLADEPTPPPPGTQPQDTSQSRYVDGYPWPILRGHPLPDDPDFLDWRDVDWSKVELDS